MDWELRLVTLYECICKHYREHLWVYCQRFSPYADVAFSDEEVICIYLWGVMDKRRELKTIYKAYADELLVQATRADQELALLIPVKKAKGQEYLDAADQWWSTAVSRVRQPIESLFNWIEEKTGIQRASKVRSTNGLLVHVFGRLAAAMCLLAEAQSA